MAAAPPGCGFSVACRSCIRSFNEEIARLQELGVQATEEDLALMAHKCAVGVSGAMGLAGLLNKEDMLAIFRTSC